MAIHASPDTGLGDPKVPGCSLAGRRHAFSLIEVVIALGIFAFAIVPIIGLLGSGMGTLKDSMSDTVRSDIARRIVGEYQRMPFTNFTEGTSVTNFYDVEGVPTNSNSAIFRAIVNLSSLTNPLITTSTNNALMLDVTVQHFGDTNSRTRYSQILVNSAQ
jgi:uncharacterized protein (TIGR02598 family)